jgi:hypothetical protein
LANVEAEVRVARDQQILLIGAPAIERHVLL